MSPSSGSLFSAAAATYFRLFSIVAVATTTCVICKARSAFGSCEIPEQWRGLWYEGDIGDVTITSTNITKKGVCLQNLNDFYLFENQEIGCYSCLLVDHRHKNVLQYKESFCIGRESLERVCSTIHLETVQRTLIREPSETIPCPLSDAYHLAYNNNSGGFCHSPPSYVTPCASPGEMSFHFEQCDHTAYTYKRDVYLECLAIWSDSADFYMVGRLRGEGFARKNDQYRCFMYQVRGTVVQAAMSADSSCRGLRSPTNGPVLLELTQDVMGWPQLTCQFPDWVTRTTWRDLDSRRSYQAFDSSRVIRLLLRQTPEAEVEVVKSFRCHRTMEGNATSVQFVAIAFVSSLCLSQYQCIKFVRRKEVIEIHEGRLMTDAVDQCLDSDLVDTSRRILIRRYNIHTGSTSCRSYFRSGCNGSTILDIVSSCAARPGLQLRCLMSWEEKSKRFLIARPLDSTTGQANCFSFRYEESQIRFSTDSECNAGAAPILRDRVTYVMEKTPLVCDFIGKTGKDLTLSIQGTNIAHDNQYGGVYSPVNATRQQRKPKIRQESAMESGSDSFHKRILLAAVFISWVIVRTIDQRRNCFLH